MVFLQCPGMQDGKKWSNHNDILGITCICIYIYIYIYIYTYTHILPKLYFEAEKCQGIALNVGNLLY
jgi:hypothetical protein